MTPRAGTTYTDAGPTTSTTTTLEMPDSAAEDLEGPVSASGNVFMFGGVMLDSGSTQGTGTMYESVGGTFLSMRNIFGSGWRFPMCCAYGYWNDETEVVMTVGL